MWLTQATFIGVVPLAGRPGAYGALDGEGRRLGLARGSLGEVVAFCGGQRRAVVALAAPTAPSRRLLQQPDYRDALEAPLRPGRWQEGRVAEFLLRRHNLRMLPTPADAERAPAWMRVGFRLYEQLRRMGYRPYPSEESPHQVLETYPYAVFAALLGHLPFRKETLEGRIQRQLVLQEQGLDLPNPLRIFEEFTRHRILSGVLPTEGLFTPAELDALVAAWTAWKAATAPEEVTTLGDPDEGQIVLPVAALRARYTTV